MAQYLDPKNDLTFKRVFGEHIREAVGYMERSAYSKEQLQAYDKWKINILTERGMIDDAREEGREQGREQGREEGETIVFEKVVVNSRRAGYSIEAITTTTGLTSEQIIEILKRHGLI